MYATWFPDKLETLTANVCDFPGNEIIVTRRYYNGTIPHQVSIKKKMPSTEGDTM